MRGEALVEKPCAQDYPEGAYAVFPGNFLAFLVGPTNVAYRYLVDSYAPLREPNGQFWLQSKVFAHQSCLLEYVCADGFVTGLHVSVIQVAYDIREPGQKLVADTVPVVQHPAAFAAGEPGAEHGVGRTVDNGFDQSRDFRRIVFKISILNNGDISGHIGD